MDNKQLLNQAIELLQEVDAGVLETVQVNHTKYDDGSVGFTVELVYPAKDTVEVFAADTCKEVIKPEISA